MLKLSFSTSLLLLLSSNVTFSRTVTLCPLESNTLASAKSVFERYYASEVDRNNTIADFVRHGINKILFTESGNSVEFKMFSRGRYKYSLRYALLDKSDFNGDWRTYALEAKNTSDGFVRMDYAQDRNAPDRKKQAIMVHLPLIVNQSVTYSVRFATPDIAEGSCQ